MKSKKRQPLEKILKKSQIRWETSHKEDEILEALERVQAQAAKLHHDIEETEKQIAKMDDQFDTQARYLGYKSGDDYERKMKKGAKKMGMSVDEYERYLIDKEDDDGLEN